jgi:hypothetical protein
MTDGFDDRLGVDADGCDLRVHDRASWRCAKEAAYRDDVER